MRSLFRLAHALHDERVDYESRIRGLLATLCSLTDSRTGTVWLARDVVPGRAIRCADLVDYGWSTAAERRAYCSYLRGGPVAHPAEAIVRAARHPNVLTRSGDQLLDADAWYRSAHVIRVCRPAGVDHCLYSVSAHTRPGWVSTIELHRAWGDDGPHTTTQRRLLRLVHAEVAWLHERSPVYAHAVSGTTLTPRLATILDALLEGLSEKQVAERLKLSYHTVHSQVGLVYQRFGVHSRAELLARHLRSKWGAPADARPRRAAGARTMPPAATGSKPTDPTIPAPRG
jgi:DNA-binding CsgD family transcriptional regulator